MLHVILFQPEIPQNTGNVGRMCACAGARLHLIHPLGFTITDAKLKRAGMDYWHSLDIRHHDDWDAFLRSPDGPTGRIWLCTTRATRTLWETRFADGDGLLFGRESAGVPDWLRARLGDDTLRIPHFDESGLRSLNLSTAAGIVTYEALRQVRAL